jgi:hypothetical protein
MTRRRISATASFTAQDMLHTLRQKVTIALCGPWAEYLGLIAGIAFSDGTTVSRLACRRAAAWAR